MSAVFITGTGTDIGKTFVTIGLIYHLKTGGRSMQAIKPVLTGFEQSNWRTSDPAALLSALGAPVTCEQIEQISPWRFSAPLSPNMAARQEDRSIVFEEVIEFCRKSMTRDPGVLLIEGIGGVMVPLDEDRTVLDLISVLRIPTILVTGTYVGTISHTLTALEVLCRRNVDVAAVAVSESAASAATLDATVATLAHFADSIDVIGIPRLATPLCSHASFARLADLI